VSGSAFNFSTLTTHLSLYSKDLPEHLGLYGTPPAIPHAHHRPDMYSSSTTSFHPSFSAAAAVRGSVTATTISPYQIPTFSGSHPPPYQPPTVTSQTFPHSQPRGAIDPYQPFFQGSPHVMGLLPHSGYSTPYTHALNFNRPG